MYVPKTSIHKHIIKSMPYFSGTMLDVGCGYMPYKKLILEQSAAKQYLGMDLDNSAIYTETNPDILWDGYTIPLADGMIDSVMITEVLEHCPYPAIVLKEVARVLKPKGKIVFSVPFLWPLHESPWDLYRYTPFAIEALFKDAGLAVPVLETYGSNDRAMLHCYMIWLKKSRLPKVIRFLIYLFTLPFLLLFLMLTNIPNSCEHKDGKMFVGIVGIGEKQ
jgi:SAM-dependent methyltransferase